MRSLRDPMPKGLALRAECRTPWRTRTGLPRLHSVWVTAGVCGPMRVRESSWVGKVARDKKRALRPLEMVR